ncbi:hypothetical protein SAY86_000710 [Trapa natans]|uniref:Uncharacterized protein n=1 Tax=Trapa natans TaxID=22666 RepID=A0AAN7MP22_TRANT|nr:hypothetical protein SAY86_000710 [Trapa natans]
MLMLPKPSYVSGSYHQPAYQTRGPPPAQWGPPRGSPYSSHPMMGYDYQQQRGGHYPSQNAQYPPSYYPPAPPQAAPRQSGYGFGWEQRPPHGGSSYDFYGGHGPARAPGPHTGAPAHGQGSGLQPNYHYGQSTQGPPPEYGHAGPYPSQPIPSHQGYGHSGYENAAPPHSYGSSQPAYPPTAAPQSGYYTQQQYGKPPPTASYGMNTQYPPQSYGNPRANQQGGGDAMAMYHSGSSNQMYGSQQQVYPSTYTAASEPPPVQQQQQQQPTTYPMYSTDNQGQGRVATYGSYPYSAPTAGYPITDQQAAAYHHQAASAAAPQDPAATAAATAYMQQQQQVMGYTEQPSTAHATYAQTDSATQQVYGAPPAAH